MIITDDPADTVLFVIAVIQCNCIQLFTEQPDLYKGQNGDKWKICPKFLKWTNINAERRNMIRAVTFDGLG